VAVQERILVQLCALNGRAIIPFRRTSSSREQTPWNVIGLQLRRGATVPSGVEPFVERRIART